MKLTLPKKAREIINTAWFQPRQHAAERFEKDRSFVLVCGKRGKKSHSQKTLTGYNYFQT